MNVRSDSLETMSVEFGFKSIHGKVDIKVDAFTAGRVTGSMKAINWRSLANKWNHLKGIDLSIIRTRPIIDALNGIDDADLHCSIQEMKRKPEEPFERLTPPGRANIGYINGSM